MSVNENEYLTNKKLKRFPKINELLNYDEETGTYEVIWNDYNIQAITNIVKTVVNKHYKNPSMTDEYISHALTKVVDVLMSGEFDYKNYGTTAGLKNFLYTCARNSLTDYTYHFVNPNKEVFYDTTPESTDTNIYHPVLSQGDVLAYIEYFKNRFPLVNIDFNPSEFVFLVKALGFEVNAPIKKPLPEHEYVLEKCLSIFPRWYFKNKL
jgi:hypothetical protein